MASLFDEPNTLWAATVKPTILHGRQAIAKANELYPGQITQGMVDLIKWEGYSPGVYPDSPTDASKTPVATGGFGQTGANIGKPLPEVYQTYTDQVRKAVTDFDNLPEQMQSALVVARYRGDLKGRVIALLNTGEFEKAATEYLNHNEYKRIAADVEAAKNPQKVRNRQIYDRMNWVSEIIKKGK